VDPQGELRPGELFAGHRIEGVAGRGGMGVVYRATALDLDRVVALKLVAWGLAADVGFRERFVRESRVAASLDHPNVIPVFSAGEEGGRLYLSMRYVDGDDLRTLIRRETRLAAPRAARIVAQVGAALDAAHARGIVHRDVKPANVLLAAGDHAYLTDFGLTKRLHSDAPETRPGGWVGTLGYVAPEQIRGERVDARADVYALGCVLFHALTGATPYARESDEATLWAHLHEPPPAVGPHAPGAPAGFEDVIARALAKDPDDRYPSAGDLGRAALAAATLAPAPDAEHTVAVGAAAARAVEVETRASPLGAGDTPAAPTRVARPGRPVAGRRRAALAAGAVGVAAVAAVALVLLPGGDGGVVTPSTRRSSVPAAAAPAPRTAGRVTTTLPTGPRPNALTIAGGRLWVASPGETRLRLFDVGSDKPAGRSPKVGIGTAALDAGYGSVWVAKSTTQTLLRYGATSATRRGAPTPLPPGTAVAVAAGERGVWVGSRSRGRNVNAAQTVARIDPGSAQPARPPLPQADGVQDLAVGDGAVWVVGRRRAVVTRIDVATGATTRTILGGDPQRIAIGQGSVWISNDDGTVTQLGLRSAIRRRIRVGGQPRGLAVGRGAVWVANTLDGTATRIDPRTGRTVGQALPVGSNPSAVAVRGTTAWVSLLGDNAVARIDFTP
jgi:DNA-binding beta-propeller fold protein YncE